jgi:hypothetical protein
VVLVDFLRANADIFAWSPSDMSGIPREVAEHSLDILPHARAVQQRLRRFDEERRRAIGAELQKLLDAGFIKEVFHPTWLANPVLVKKKNGKWRMCIDYTSLNKACPKVPFPLLRIDQIVDSTAGCELLCFLDAYSGYHQIKMKESDQLATSFITPFGMFCYVTMPFGLRRRSSRRSGCSATSRCRLASETQAQRINAACNTFSEITSGGQSRRMWMTSSLKPGRRTTWSATLASRSAGYGPMGSN